MIEWLIIIHIRLLKNFVKPQSNKNTYRNSDYGTARLYMLISIW